MAKSDVSDCISLFHYICSIDSLEHTSPKAADYLKTSIRFFFYAGVGLPLCTSAFKATVM